MTTKTYHGSCHCGAVTFEADIDLAAGTGKCNCTYCRKRRNWGALLKPEQFRLLSGEEALGEYQFGTKSGHHRFCSKCGIAPFGTGYVEAIGGAFVSVQVLCLDDVPLEELEAAPINYADGLHDAWWQEPAEKGIL
ncbi:GFA family protein [Sphingomonas sp. Sphisp140]|uniref:GFA family protein n=1 Tax=unclassified Sphingomonas TaxID=196159 RepID=UPI0039AEA9F0